MSQNNHTSLHRSQILRDFIELVDRYFLRLRVDNPIFVNAFLGVDGSFCVEIELLVVWVKYFNDKIGNSFAPLLPTGRLNSRRITGALSILRAKSLRPALLL